MPAIIHFLIIADPAKTVFFLNFRWCIKVKSLLKISSSKKIYANDLSKLYQLIDKL